MMKPAQWRRFADHVERLGRAGEWWCAHPWLSRVPSPRVVPALDVAEQGESCRVCPGPGLRIMDVCPSRRRPGVKWPQRPLLVEEPRSSTGTGCNTVSGVKFRPASVRVDENACSPDAEKHRTPCAPRHAQFSVTTSCSTATSTRSV